VRVTYHEVNTPFGKWTHCEDMMERSWRCPHLHVVNLTSVAFPDN